MSKWLITGCSSGLGRNLAVLKRGDNAVVTARKLSTIQDIVASYPDIVLALQLDVTSSIQVAQAVKQAETRFGGVDVLINNAGHGYRAAVEEADEAEVGFSPHGSALHAGKHRGKPRTGNPCTRRGCR